MARIVPSQVVALIDRCFPTAVQQQEVEERLLEEELDGAIVRQVDLVELGLEHTRAGAAVVLVGELDILRGDLGTVVKLETRAQLEDGRLQGEQRQMRAEEHL